MGLRLAARRLVRAQKSGSSARQVGGPGHSHSTGSEHRPGRHAITSLEVFLGTSQGSYVLGAPGRR
eukprot:187844-Pyramimonas_sp.AAC.1